MTREELIKMFDKKFSYICENMPIISNDMEYFELEDIKQYIFETIIPEVLNSVVPGGNNNCTVNNYIKPKIQELYGITL